MQGNNIEIQEKWKKKNRLVKRSCVRSPSSTSSVKECIGK